MFAYNIKMAGNSAWNQAVKQAFKMGRSVNKNYSLKQAMMDAKKIYRKGKGMAMGKTMKKRRSFKNKGYGRRRTRGGSHALPFSELKGGDKESEQNENFKGGKKDDDFKGGAPVMPHKGGKKDDDDNDE